MLENLSYEELKAMLKGIIAERDELLLEINQFKKRFTPEFTEEEMEEQYKAYYGK